VESPALSIAVAEQLDLAGLQKLPPSAADPAALAIQPADPNPPTAPKRSDADKSTSIAAALDDTPPDAANKPDDSAPDQP
jgi:hypothetical protein